MSRLLPLLSAIAITLPHAMMARTTPTTVECALRPSGRHFSPSLEEEYIALQNEVKLLNRAFYALSTSLPTTASARRPVKRLLKLDERLLTLHAHILLRQKPPLRLRKELASLLRELSRWRIEYQETRLIAP